MGGLVVLARLADPMVAHLLQGLLEEEGIAARVVEERVGDHVPPAYRAAVEVLPEDLPRARAVLEEVRAAGGSAAAALEDAPPAPTPRLPRTSAPPSDSGPCPQCGSPHSRRLWWGRGRVCRICGARRAET